MHTEDYQNWSRWLARKSPQEQADHLLSKLIGYRLSGVYREMDVQYLAIALEAIQSAEEPHE